MVAVALAVTGAPAVAQYKIIEQVWVKVPDKKPNGNLWDPEIGGILTFRLRGYLPDIVVCIESAQVPKTCGAMCKDSKECVARLGVLLEGSARVRIVDIDPDGEELIAEKDLPNPQACQPCSFDMPGGRLELRVDVVERSMYVGPFRGSVGVPRPPAATPPAPGGLPSAGMSAADIGSALADLRARDNCVGSDRVFPSGTMMLRARALLLGDKVNRYYQMAAFAAAIPDPPVQQLVLQQIRTSLGDDEYDNIFVPFVWSDVQDSRQLTAAFVDATRQVAQMLISKGLDQLVPPPIREQLPQHLRRWMMDKLSGSRVRDLVNGMANFDVSAECAMNELAKQAFASVAAR
jgi:hypothetical protein